MSKQTSLDNPSIMAQVRIRSDGSVTMPYEVFRDLPTKNIEKALNDQAKRESRARADRIKAHEAAREANEKRSFRASLK